MIDKDFNDIERAKEILSHDNNTCVLVSGELQYISTVKGISPMMDYISGGTDLNGFSVADKIVGKAVAMLFALAGIIEVYAEVLSKSGEEILKVHNIKYSYQTLVDYIADRTGTGLCPMEEAVLNVSEPSIAFDAIKDKIQKLRMQAVKR